MAKQESIRNQYFSSGPPPQQKVAVAVVVVVAVAVHPLPWRFSSEIAKNCLCFNSNLQSNLFERNPKKSCHENNNINSPIGKSMMFQRTQNYKNSDPMINVLYINLIF